jgi:sugar lactone lactonase YvrE
VCVCQAISAAEAPDDEPVEIEGANSPNGRYVLAASGNDDDALRIQLKATEGSKVLAQFRHTDYRSSDTRYSVTVRWNEQSDAFALNIEQGRNITLSRVFAEHRGKWKEAPLPEKTIERARRKGNRKDGKFQDYFWLAEWMPKDRLAFHYQGNLAEEYTLICRLVRGGRPRVELVEFRKPAAEQVAEPTYDYENYTWTKLAGGSEGSKDGMGSDAQFRWPNGVAVDRAGNIFVGDRGNHVIRKVQPDGAVTTFAGSAGAYGKENGDAATARFWYPMGLAVDGADNVYVADSSSQTVRKVTPSGDVTIVAGSTDMNPETRGFGTAEHLNNPRGVAVDASGVVYVADTNNHVIRRIAPGEPMTTLAGVVGSEGPAVDGDSKTSRLRAPFGIDIDARGTLFITEGTAIRKIEPNGTVTTFAGSLEEAGETDGTGSTARFTYACDVAVDSAGNVFVADGGTKSIRKITQAGMVKTLRDVTNPSPFVKPVGIAVDDKGSIYVTDEDGFAIFVGKPAK